MHLMRANIKLSGEMAIEREIHLIREFNYNKCVVWWTVKAIIMLYSLHGDLNRVVRDSVKVSLFYHIYRTL